MKSKILIAALLGIGVLPFSGISQTNPAAADQPMAETAPTNPPAMVAEIDTNATVVATNAVVIETNVTVIDTNAVVVDTNATIIDTNAVVVGQSANLTLTNQPAAFPLIQFQDVPLTTAIENLARQAKINYLLDPKIGYGQPDKNGQIKPEPILSVRWEKLTARQALLALLDNYGLQLNEDPDTHVARVTLKNPAALPPLEMRVIQLQYASVTNMMESVASALTDNRSRVVPDARTSQLVVVATEQEQTNVDALVKELDTPTRQVLIETKLVEISSNPNTSKGIDWSGTLAAQNIAFGNNLPIKQINTAPGFPNQLYDQTVSSPGVVANTAAGFGSMGFLNADGVHAVLSFLNASSDAQVISTPRVVTLDNQPATISVTTEFPIINVTASTPGVSTGSSSITYSNVGTVLTVTPHISANDKIWMRVVPDVSAFLNVDTKIIAGVSYQADVFNNRRIETQVLIPNAHTLVMGGMVQDDPKASYTKVPFLGDIPFLGYAFRSENKSLNKDNLLIFITPTILKDSDFRPTETTFLKAQPPMLNSPMNPNKVWDSAQPAGDWSNPHPVPGEFGESKTNSMQVTSIPGEYGMTETNSMQATSGEYGEAETNSTQTISDYDNYKGLR
ncbi:MAG: type II secretion system protein GspD [Limisphaerales bacterium]